MKAIFGLGNPGTKYTLSRHNVGFQVIDLYRRTNEIRESGIIDCSSLIYRIKDVLLVKPMTYMNLSGKAVSTVLDKYRVNISDALVVYDDLDLAFGTMKILPGGGASTHNGMLSVVSALDSEQVPRLRIGIGNHQEHDPISYVLGRFSPREWKELLPGLKRAADAVTAFCNQDIQLVMNEFNWNDLSTSSKGG